MLHSIRNHVSSGIPSFKDAGSASAACLPALSGTAVPISFSLRSTRTRTSAAPDSPNEDHSSEHTFLSQVKDGKEILQKPFRLFAHLSPIPT